MRLLRRPRRRAMMPDTGRVERGFLRGVLADSDVSVPCYQISSDEAGLMGSHVLCDDPLGTATDRSLC